MSDWQANVATTDAIAGLDVSFKYQCFIRLADHPLLDDHAR
jgi:hypothetical protein